MRLKLRYIRYIIAGFLFLLILFFRYSPAGGEWYVMNIYPVISAVLSSFSSLFPFSLGDIFIFSSITGIIIYPIAGRINGIPWKRTLLRVGEYLLWVYIWFYIAWGITYFREDFYNRTNVKRVTYSEEHFKQFLHNYADSLNAACLPVKWLDNYKLEEEVKSGYQEIYSKFGLCQPKGWQRVKTMLFSSFMSKVGVSGYMGPFFCEFNVNGDVLALQYPSTYAHEMAHLLGVSNEAEANLYAYLVCTNSRDKNIRFSGYFSLLSHVLRNAYALLTPDEYNAFLSKITPEVIDLYKENRAYWSEKYSPVIGEMQDTIYDWFLKGNKISSGKANYSEVIGLLLSLDVAR